MTHGEIVKHGISIETNFAQDLPPIQGDRIQLQQVILNLIMNATEAMRACPERTRHLVMRTARTKSDGVLVIVRDTGPGLCPEDIERIFDAFYTTKPEGLGMGLAIWRSLIRAHGGRLWATSGFPEPAALPCSFKRRRCTPILKKFPDIRACLP